MISLDLLCKYLHLVGNVIDIFSGLLEYTSHYPHEFILSNFLLSTDSPHESDRNKLSLTCLVDVVKICTLQRKGLGNNCYQLFKHEPEFTNCHLHTLSVAIHIEQHYKCINGLLDLLKSLSLSSVLE